MRDPGRGNPATGEVVSTLGSRGSYHVTGLAVHPTSGVIYATANGSTTQCFDWGRAVLLTLNATTGAATFVGNIYTETIEHQIPDIAFDASGTLYGWSEWDDNLYTIDITTGAATLVGQSGVDTAQTGLAIKNTGTIYIKNGRLLYTVDATNGQATFVTGLDAWPDNLLAFDTSDGLFTGTRNQAPQVSLTGGRKGCEAPGLQNHCAVRGLRRHHGFRGFGFRLQL